MTTQRDFKRVVRTRMQKTGESYTTARAQLVRRTVTPPLEPSIKPAPRAPSDDDYARLAGMSDAAVKKATGCAWASWVKALDHAGAQAWPHRAITEYVHDKFKTPSWWTQMVAVGYERIRGLRERGQQRGGTYRTTKSRTFPVALGKLYAVFSDRRRRAAWLGSVKLTVRTATRNRSMRITWEDGTSLDVGFTSKGRSKSQVALEHGRLESRAAAERIKAFWGERLEELAGQLS